MTHPGSSEFPYPSDEQYRFHHETVHAGLQHERHRLSERVPVEMHWPIQQRSELATISNQHRGRSVYMPRQVHSNGIAVIGQQALTILGPQNILEGVDGLITRQRNVVLAAKSADCAILSATDGRYIGIAHAGWRGIQKGMPQAFALRFKELGCDLDELQVRIGPSIGPCCYRAESEQFQQRIKDFRDLFDPDITEEDEQGEGLNLRYALVSQLLSCKVPFSNIDIDQRCTACHTDWPRPDFPSHKRLGWQRSHNLVTTIRRMDDEQ